MVRVHSILPNKHSQSVFLLPFCGLEPPFDVLFAKNRCELKLKIQVFPFLRCLDCGVCVAIRLVRFGYNPSTGRIALRVAPISPLPFKGTHGDRIAGDNSTRLTQSVTIAIPSLRSLRSRHNFRHFSYYATSPAWQLRNRTPRMLVLHTQGLPHVKNKRTCA